MKGFIVTLALMGLNLNSLNLKLLILLLLFCACGSNNAQKVSRFASYDSLKSFVKELKAEFNTAYKSASESQKDSILKAANDSLSKLIINDYFGHWYGTAWEFEGTTRTPKEGTIACGYFVTTVLEDAGFNIPRVKWACVPSETMIKGMTKKLKHIINRPVSEVEEYIRKSGKGLYVVGLDNHTGFIYNDGTIIRFVHSNYYLPQEGVMEQELDSHNPLKNSKYRVIGKILDDAMMKSWILNKRME